MSIFDVLTIVGVLLTVVGVVVAFYYGRLMLDPPKRRLRWSYEMDSLFANVHSSVRDTLEIRALGQRLRNPHLVTLIIRNDGRQDVNSEMYDQNRPLRFRISGKVATVFDLQDGPPHAAVHGNTIELGPELLRAGERWVLRVIADGEPSVELIENYLTGVRLAEDPAGGDPMRRDSETIRTRQIIELALLVGTTGFLLALLAELIALQGK